MAVRRAGAARRPRAPSRHVVVGHGGRSGMASPRRGLLAGLAAIGLDRRPSDGPRVIPCACRRGDRINEAREGGTAMKLPRRTFLQLGAGAAALTALSRI